MLEMDLKYVGKANILKDASEMITFDEQAGLVTFDRGNNSVFEYKLSESFIRRCRLSSKCSTE